jgi:3-deoxy-D-manno-octulosonate 8-phosphate phosphatase (KDO 8-P phosphatase)
MKVAVESGYKCVSSGGSNATAIEKFGNYRYSFGHTQSRNFKEYAELYNINPEHVLYGRYLIFT